MYFSKEIFFIFIYFNINCINSVNARFIRSHNKRSFSAMEGLLKLKGRMLANAVMALEKQQGDSENDKRHNSSDPKFDSNYLGSFPIATPRTLRVEDITEPKITYYPTCPPTTTEAEHVKPTTRRMPYSHKYQHKNDNREEETATRRQQTEEVTHRYDNSKHKPPKEPGEGEEGTKKHDDNKEDTKTQKPTDENREGEEVTRKHESNEEVTKKNDADRENQKEKPSNEDRENEEVTRKNDTDQEEPKTKNEDKKPKPADDNREDEEVTKKPVKDSDQVTNKCGKKQKPTESNREGEESTGKPKEKVEKPTNEKEEATETPDTDNEKVEKTTVRQRTHEGDKSTDEKPPETSVEKPQTKQHTEATPSNERNETTESSTTEQSKDKEETQSKDEQTTATKTTEEKPQEKIKGAKEEKSKEQKEDKQGEQKEEKSKGQKEQNPKEETVDKTSETTETTKGEEEEEECEEEETETEPTTRVPNKTLIKIVVVQPKTTTTESGQEDEDSEEECEPDDEETESDKTSTAKSNEIGKKCFAPTTPSNSMQVTAAGQVYQNANYPTQSYPGSYPGSYPAITQCYPLGQTYNYPTAMQPPPAMQPYPPPPSPPPAMQPYPPTPDMQPYPTVTQAYPTVTQAYPMPTQAYPKQTPTYPMATQAYPTVTQAYPLETQTYPTETQAYPTAAQSYPIITQCYPIETQSYPAATQSYPTVPQSYPSAAQPYPQTYPTVTQSYPTVTQCYPVDTQPYPTATQSYPTEYQPLANSTQEATTQSNQQTIFSLVTSNVTQNATAPPPSLIYAMTCFPITETPTTVKPASRKRRLYKIRRHIGSGGFHKHTRTPYMHERKKRRRVKRELRENENNFIDTKKLSSLVHLAAQPHFQRSLLHGLRGSTNSNYNHRNFISIDYPDEEQGPKYARRSKVVDSIDYNTNMNGEDQSNIFEDTMRVKLPLCPTKPPATKTMSDTCSGKNHNIQHFKQPHLPKPCPLPMKPCKKPCEDLKDLNFEPTEFPMPIPNIGGSMKFNDTCKQQEPSNEPNLSANDFTSNNNEDRASDECDDFGIEQFLKKSDAQIALENFRKAEANDPISQKLSFMGRLLGRNSKCADKNKPPCESKSKSTAVKKPCPSKTMESQSYLDIDTPTTSVSPFKRILGNWLKSKPNCDICHQKVKLNDILHHRESIKKFGEGTTKFRRQNRKRAQNFKLRRSDSACINNHLSWHSNPEHYRTHANKRRNAARYMNKAVNAKFMPRRSLRRRSIIRRPRYAYEESNSRLKWRDADDMPDLSLNWEGDSGYDRNIIY